MKLSNKILIIGLAVVLGGMLFVGAGTRIMIGGALKKDQIGVESADLGERVRKTFDFADFSEISASGIYEISITRGDEYSAAVELEEGLVDEFKIKKQGPKLVLAMKDDMYRIGSDVISIELVMPELTGISLQGCSNVAVNGFSSELLDIVIEGASNVVGKDNEIEDLFLSCDGAVNVNLKSSKTVNAEVDLAGASQVALTMDGGILEGKIEGLGSLDYYGKVVKENVGNQGLSKVKKH